METNLFEDRLALIDIGRPIDEAPARTASPEVRSDWAERYVTWFLGEIEQDGPLPKDVSPTHLYQVEFSSCMLDPQEYERQTLDELAAQRATMH